MTNIVKILFSVCLLIAFVTPNASAKLPDEIMEPYKAYRAALKAKDKKKAKINALKAWEAAEKALGDHKTTGDLAYNYGSIGPDGSEKNPYKNYEKRAEAIERAIELSSYYDADDVAMTEVERRLALADLELTVTRHRRTPYRADPSTTIGRLKLIKKLEEAIDKHSLRGSTFDGDLNVLYARYYEVNGQPKKSIEYGQKAIDIYKSTTDNLFSKYAYFIHLFKGNSHYELANKSDDIDEKINAALEYQVVMQNLEGKIPADHVFVKTAFQSWMKTRSEIEEAGFLEKAENEGLCECWPFENYKDKAIPLKRIPPKMPSNARSSGHVFVKFDVTDDGKPENIKVVSSSKKLFESSALKSVEKWVYSKREDGSDPENRKNITTKIRYKLQDRSGNNIPE